MATGLLNEHELEHSSIVANNAMNRERGLDGVNSYTKDLGFNPLNVLRESPGGAWLDLCCGSGRALIQAAHQDRNLTLVGVDLVDYFDQTGADLPGLTLTAAPISSWQPEHAFDLITCVHGLHYVGDKLGVLARILSWLTPGGVFAANLDLASIKPATGAPIGRSLRRLLVAAGVGYDARRRLISCRGPRDLSLPFDYVGADDAAGPNYTGQPAVDSYYRPARTS